MKSKIHNFYGLAIRITDETEEAIFELMKRKPDHKAEVVIRYKDKVKEMSLGEFLQKLGFFDK